MSQRGKYQVKIESALKSRTVSPADRAEVREA